MRKKTLIASLPDFLIIALSLYAINASFDSSLSFRMFCVSGSCLTMIASALSIIWRIRTAKQERKTLTVGIYLLRLMAAVSEFIIISIVLIVLVPYEGKSILTGVAPFLLRLIVPVVTIVSFIPARDRPVNMPRIWAFVASIPLLAYGLSIFILCLIGALKGDAIPYPFFAVHNHPIWLSVLFMLCLTLSVLCAAWIFDGIKLHRSNHHAAT